MYMRIIFCTYTAVLKDVALHGLPSSRKSVRTHSCGLGKLAATALFVALMTGCQGGVDERIRHVHRLAVHPTDANKSRIEAMLADPDRDVRATALVVMEGADRERAKRMAAAALDDADELVRAAAVPISGEDADDDMIRRLAAKGLSDTSWQVRARCLAAISRSDDPAVYEAYALALSDEASQVRSAALAAGLTRPGLLPTDRVVALLADDPAWENRVEAARTLGVSQDPGAYPGLDAALSDPNEFVRATAARERQTLERSGAGR
jgi:HEAT repeat protein